MFRVFVASLGLALVLRGVLFSARARSPRTYRIDVYQVYDIGGVRLSESQLIAIVIAFVGDRRSSALLFSRDARLGTHDAGARRRPRARRDRGHRHRRASS